MTAYCSPEVVTSVLSTVGISENLDVRLLRDHPHHLVAVACESEFPQEIATAVLRAAGLKVTPGEERGERFLFVYEDASVLDEMRLLGVSIGDVA